MPSELYVYRFYFKFWLAVRPPSLSALFGFIYKRKLRQSLTYEDDFMKVKIYIAISCDICINTQFKSTSTNNVKSDIITKWLALLPVDWNKNCLNTYEPYSSSSMWWKRLLFNHRHEPSWTVFSFVVHIKRMYIYKFRKVEFEERKFFGTVRRSL